jgi:hypothetical protein
MARPAGQAPDLPHARNLRADARRARIFRREITTYDESYPVSQGDELFQTIIRQRVATNAFVSKVCGAQKNAHFANVDELLVEVGWPLLAIASRTATLGRRLSGRSARPTATECPTCSNEFSEKISGFPQVAGKTVFPGCRRLATVSPPQHALRGERGSSLSFSFECSSRSNSY